MLRYLTKAEAWQDLDAGLHDDLGWKITQVHMKTFQDMAVYRHLKDVRGKTIAEIGGGHSRILRKIAADNTCVNVDKLEGQDGGPKGDAGIPGVRTVRAFLGDFDPGLEDNSFDHVISVSVVEHVPHTLTDAFFDDMQRILKVGGTAIHAIDMYVGDAPIRASQHRLELYGKWLERTGIEPLEPVAAHSALFSSAMVTNPDLTMWQWGRVSPGLNELRANSQGVTLLLGFRKRGVGTEPVRPEAAAATAPAAAPVMAKPAAPAAAQVTAQAAPVAPRPASPAPSAPAAAGTEPISNKRIASFEVVLDALKASGIDIGHTIDGGGGAGHTAKQMLARTPATSFCYTFEPFPGNHRFFEGADPRLILHKAAMAETAKTSRFRVSSTVSEDSEWGKRGMAGYSSVGALVDKAPTNMTSIEVQCVAADDVIPADHVVGFVKLDLQGGELGALRGMERIMSTAKVMWVEFSNQPGLLEFLHNRGFKLYDTEYFCLGEATEAARAEFDVTRDNYTLSTGKTAWFGFRKAPWPDYAETFHRMKTLYGLVQTDLICVPHGFVPDFEAAMARAGAGVAQSAVTGTTAAAPVAALPDTGGAVAPGAPGLPSLEAFRDFVKPRQMALEEILAEVYAARCAGRTGFVLFDGGAHRAYHTLKMLALPGCDKVYAVEADPFMARTCEETLARSAPEAGDRLVLVKQALQNDPERREIAWKSSPSHVGRSSVVSTTPERATIWDSHGDVEYRAEMTVPATTIDAILKDEPRPLPFLKLDLEGADLLALTGAEATLRSKRPLVAFENSVHAPRVHGFAIEDIAAWFDRLDYVPLNAVGVPIGPDNWFGFFEAWAAPREDVAWLQTTLARVIARHMGRDRA